jgi:diguanylate cyclase (GGDEF)-like protein
VRLPRTATPREDAGRDGPPRLVLRFALTTCVGLALACAAILLFVRHSNTVQAERAATSEARVIAASALRGELLASDFERGLSPPRRAALDELFEQHVLGAGVVVSMLHAADGTVTYSTDHRLIGKKTAELAHLAEARAGTIRGDVTIAPATGPETKTPKALRVYAPVAVPGGTGVVSIYQDYAPIARAAESAFLPVAAIFEVVLLALFAVLLPILRRVSKRIRRQMDEIEHRALYDELTGLPNRTLFRDRTRQALATARRESGRATVLFLDVDRFREINDALGHDAGDALLRELGARLGGALRESDTLARLGGDEFGILLPGTPRDDALLLAARVHEALDEPFAFGDFPLDVTTSIGVASFPEHGEDVDALLQHADVAMYLAKDAHAGTAVYDVEQDTNDAARLALAGELRGAIERGELVVHYQPKADLSSGRVVGVEALVRWEHPEHGLLSSDRFVPIAERTGLIRPLTRHVLGVAVAQARAWKDEGLDLDVAVNLTIPDLLDLELPDRIAMLLRESGLEADRLELEITESSILADPFRVRQVLTRLHQMGLRLAIDDFGTGYSSLAYLKRLPVHAVKIDRSFVSGMCQDPSDATIVRSTIDLGRNLGLAIVAEGVESLEIWNALRGLGCSLAQGYLIGRPLPADELVALLGSIAESSSRSPAQRFPAASGV